MSLGRMVAILSLDASQFRDGLNSAAKQLDEMSGKFAGAGAALTAGVTLPLAGVATAAIQAGSEMEMASVALRNMLGSAEAAGKLLKDLRSFAATTPFEFKDLMQSTRLMVALGFEAKNVIPIMRTLGDAVAAMGGGGDVLQRIIMQLGQMQAKGKVSAEEMRVLAQTGIISWQNLADKIGMTVPEAMKAAEKGTISAAQGISAILSSLQERFGGAMQEMSETAAGRWSNIKDKIFDVLARIGEALLPIAQTVLSALDPVLDVVARMAQGFSQLPGPIQLVVVGIGALAAALGPLLLVIGGVAQGIAALNGLLGAAGLIASLKILAVVVAAVVAAWAAWQLGKWLAEFPIVKTIIDAVSDALRTLWSWILKIPGVSKLVEATKSGWEKLKGAVSGATSAAKEHAGSARTLDDVLKGLTATQGGLAVATGKTATAKKDAAAAARSFAAENEILVAKVRAVAEEHKRLVKEIAALHAKLEDSKTAFDVAAAGLDELTAKLIATGDLSQAKLGDMGKLAEATFKTLGTTGSTEIDRVRQAFETLGVKSTTELQRKQEEARRAYETIKNSGVASADEIQRAYEAMVRATKSSSETLGIDLSGTFRKSMQDVSTTVSNAAQDIVGMLIGTREGSVLSALERLGEAILAKLVEPWIQAFEQLIEKGVKKLVSWLLDKLMDALEKVAGKIFSVFGSGGIAGAGGAAGGGVAGADGRIGGAAGGAPGGVGGAVGGAAGGVIGIVTGAISAATGVIGLIQGRGQGKTLDLIEENTRFTQIALIGSDGVIDILWQINFAAWHIRTILFDNILERLVYIGDVIGGFIFPLLKDDIAGTLKEMATRPPVSINIEGNVIGQEEFITQLANVIMQRLALSGVRP